LKKANLLKDGDAKPRALRCKCQGSRVAKCNWYRSRYWLCLV